LTFVNRKGAHRAPFFVIWQMFQLDTPDRIFR
jgi:hypothetical protein